MLASYFFLFGFLGKKKLLFLLLLLFSLFFFFAVLREKRKPMSHEMDGVKILDYLMTEIFFAHPFVLAFFSFLSFVVKRENNYFVDLILMP